MTWREQTTENNLIDIITREASREGLAGLHSPPTAVATVFIANMEAPGGLYKQTWRCKMVTLCQPRYMYIYKRIVEWVGETNNADSTAIAHLQFMGTILSFSQ